MNRERDPDDCADAMRALVACAGDLNAAVAAAREALGLSVQLYVNGHEYGDRVGVRIEGDLLDAYAKATPTQEPSDD